MELKFVSVVLVSLVVASAAVATTRRLALGHGMVDQPNERSSHRRPVPRLGGIGIVTGFAVGAAAAWLFGFDLPKDTRAAVVGVALVAALGLADDLRPMRALPRFAGQVSIATLYTVVAGPLRQLDLLGFTELHLGWVAYPFSVLWIVWMINLFNFMDGIDGIAGLQCLVACVVFAMAGGATRGGADAVLSAALGAACLGFLFFNWPPASIFMGDVGSTALGFFLATAALRLANREPPALEFPAAVLAAGPFVFDATFTLVRRIRAGERWYEAHRSHLYQRPQNWGIGHGMVTSCSGVLMVLSGAGALLYQASPGPSGRVAVVGTIVAILTFVAVLVLRRDRAVARA
jgi:UDP-N-acetylmuramyl pentapeptide phosphotransferase/UDP-N-acetylglucosamine-1-phosphate transferase